jgi:hypothetical protein
VFFPVTGNFNAIADPPLSGTVNQSAAQPVNALVTFTPRVARGQQFFIGDTAITLVPLTARIYNGVLSTLDTADTPGSAQQRFQLVANTAALNLGGDLIYDVTYTDIMFSGSLQYLAPFAFKAPTDSTPVCLTDQDLVKLPYQPPSTRSWVPAPAPGTPIQLRNWRQRAAVA